MYRCTVGSQGALGCCLAGEGWEQQGGVGDRHLYVATCPTLMYLRGGDDVREVNRLNTEARAMYAQAGRV